MKRVFIIHGWDGYPEEGWFPWLKGELERAGFAVVVPQLPNPDEPRISSWVSEVARVVGTPDEETYFVGHSIGCQAVIRYLEILREDQRVGGAVFVAGFFKELSSLEDDEIVHSVAQEWLTTPVDFRKVTPKLRKSIAIFSDNDPYVPLTNKNDFEDKLGSKVIIEHQQGHFSGSTGTTELPVAFNALLEMSKF